MSSWGQSPRHQKSTDTNQPPSNHFIDQSQPSVRSYSDLFNFSNVDKDISTCAAPSTCSAPFTSEAEPAQQAYQICQQLATENPASQIGYDTPEMNFLQLNSNHCLMTSSDPMITEFRENGSPDSGYSMDIYHFPNTQPQY